jgi:PAS domain S-box-containing protein
MPMRGSSVEGRLRTENEDLRARIGQLRKSLTLASLKLRLATGSPDLHADGHCAAETPGGQFLLLEEFFTHAVVPLALVDANFDFVRVNEAFARAFCRPSADFPHRSVMDFLDPREAQAILGCATRAMPSAEETATALMLPDATEGQTRFWSWTLTPLLDSTGQTEAMVLTLEDITEQVRAQQELVALNEALSGQARQLRRLAQELTLAEHRERQRLAQILHDHLQQLLVAAKLHCTPLRNSSDEVVCRAASEVSDLIREALAASRSLTAELSPPILCESGLVGALQWLARWMREKHGLEVQVTFDDQPACLPQDVLILLFQAVRELLFNVTKHAKVDTARVRIGRDDDQIRIVVADKGVGFDPSTVLGESPLSSGFGLLSVRERLSHLGGRLEIDSAPGQGCQFTLWVPVTPEPTALP